MCPGRGELGPCGSDGVGRWAGGRRRSLLEIRCRGGAKTADSVVHQDHQLRQGLTLASCVRVGFDEKTHWMLCCNQPLWWQLPPPSVATFCWWDAASPSSIVQLKISCHWASVWPIKSFFYTPICGIPENSLKKIYNLSYLWCVYMRQKSQTLSLHVFKFCQHTDNGLSPLWQQCFEVCRGLHPVRLFKKRCSLYSSRIGEQRFQKVVRDISYFLGLRWRTAVLIINSLLGSNFQWCFGPNSKNLTSDFYSKNQ